MMTLGQYFWLGILLRVFPSVRPLRQRAEKLLCILQVTRNEFAQIQAVTSDRREELEGRRLEWRVAKLTDALLGWLLGMSVLKMHSLIEVRVAALLRVRIIRFFLHAP